MYAGKTDLIDHLNSYENLMTLQGVRQKNASHLSTIHPKDGESLKDYVKRFNQAVPEVESASDKWTGKIKIDPRKRNKNKYCEFYRVYGHNTEDYFQLKEQIADLIKRGYLKKYVVDRPCPDSPDRRYSDNKPTVGDIEVIHSRFGSGGCSSSSSKRHIREASRQVEEEVYNLSSPLAIAHQLITFTNDDLKGLHLLHDDALVILVTIANFNVQRILIDNESSVNILCTSAFDKMKIGRDKLHHFHTPLVRFEGNTTHPLGWIRLPVTLWTELKPH
ncbi:hypothetical protein Acr_13g0007220 [Actinidia rufa]|uniref:Retrotransposon gag domain-containing protein n=1 Tax=Actinidia rufa TaxID=165716 RepID=A0A7J0FKU7_9ERIC|nr:hypothetical protein Acr_13g0007220 [Actinidia rufa]